MPYRFRSDSSMELALVVLPVTAVVIVLFNACKMGKFGTRIWKRGGPRSAGNQPALVRLAGLRPAGAGGSLYTAIVRRIGG